MAKLEQKTSAQPVAVEMELEKECKSCIRFASGEEDAAVQNIYLKNSAFKALGEPKKISVTVTAP